jgi:hypothetical protein
LILPTILLLVLLFPEMKLPILPFPLAPKPIAVLVLVQLNDEPKGLVLKAGTIVVWPGQTAISGCLSIIGVG